MTKRLHRATDITSGRSEHAASTKGRYRLHAASYARCGPRRPIQRRFASECRSYHKSGPFRHLAKCVDIEPNVDPECSRRVSVWPSSDLDIPFQNSHTTTSMDGYQVRVNDQARARSVQRPRPCASCHSHCCTGTGGCGSSHFRKLHSTDVRVSAR